VPETDLFSLLTGESRYGIMCPSVFFMDRLLNSSEDRASSKALCFDRSHLDDIDRLPASSSLDA
jgi:hypothetical protein